MKNDLTEVDKLVTGTQTDSVSQTEKLRQPSSGLSLKVIEMALHKSPTGGNSKPFHWHWEKNNLIIKHSFEHAAHYLNRNNHTSWIALGCLIESVKVAALSQDWEAHSQISNDNLSAQISFTAATSSSVPIPRLIALLDRITYRGPLSKSEPPEIFTHHENSSNGIQIKLAETEDLSSEFKKFIISSETYIWLQQKATRAFFSEVRFFDHRKNERGIRSEDLGINKADQFMLYCFSFIPWLLSVIVSIPVLNFSFKQASKRNLKNAHFVLITAPSLKSLNLLNAGEAAIRLSIDLEMQGYVVQPYSMASITLVDAATNQLPTDTLEKFKTLFTQIGPEVLKNQFNLEIVEKPIWLLRVGRK